MSDLQTQPIKTVSAIMPVYYNQYSLAQLFAELQEFEKDLKERQLALELIFVDDGSGDESLVELMKIKQVRPATKVIKLTRNFGSVAASKTGFRFVTGDCFCILAADRQDPVAKVLEMVDCWLAGEKFVVCARDSREDPVSTRFFAAIYYVVIRWLIAADYPRGGFDLMLLDRTLLPHMIDSGKDTHPNLYAYWLGITPRILNYHREKRSEGRSRWTFRKKAKLFFDTITGFSVTPLRVISGFGLTVATLSFVYGLYILINGLLGRIEVPGFTTIIVLMTFFSGLILVMLGIIGEYLWRVFDATQKKPESVIDETFL
jgi:polyisoprenyl-phosphate glycosyltransferase